MPSIKAFKSYISALTSLHKARKEGQCLDTQGKSVVLEHLFPGSQHSNNICSFRSVHLWKQSNPMRIWDSMGFIQMQFVKFMKYDEMCDIPALDRPSATRKSGRRPSDMTHSNASRTKRINLFGICGVCVFKGTITTSRHPLLYPWTFINPELSDQSDTHKLS